VTYFLLVLVLTQVQVLDEQGLRDVFLDEQVMLLSYELAILVFDEQ
jgi:hypothetical protein